MLEAVRGDLVALVGETAELICLDLGDHRRHGKGRLEAEAVEHARQRVEAAVRMP